MTTIQKAKEIAAVIYTNIIEYGRQAMPPDWKEYSETTEGKALIGSVISGEDWISVKDRLPEFGKRVLVWYYPIHPVMEGQLIGIDYRREYEHLKGSIRNRLEDNKGFAIGTITHFMPLPEPPKP